MSVTAEIVRTIDGWEIRGDDRELRRKFGVPIRLPERKSLVETLTRGMDVKIIENREIAEQIKEDRVWGARRFVFGKEFSNPMLPPASPAAKKLIEGGPSGWAYETAVPAREYQKVAAALLMETKGLLLGDDVGLGKTASSICALSDPRTRPALIVCMPHLMTQWEAEIRRFLPKISVALLRGKPPEKPIRAGIQIISYAKLAEWELWLGGLFKLIVWDEVQELRGDKSARSLAARSIAKTAEYRLGLSATPIHNYADEFWRVMECVRPGVLGAPRQFARRHLTKRNGCSVFRNADKFGADLRKCGLLLRRTRKDVARELPPINCVEYRIDADAELYESLSADAGALAEIILADGADKQAKWRAAERMPNVLRMATGIAKAKYVADFVKMLLETREKVVLGGWHRQVVELWMKELAEFKPVLYSGSESPKAKQAAKRAFVDGGSRVIILSMRSGVGLDGLQRVCDTVVIGELDWTDAVHKQFVGRVARDGQKNPVDAFFMTAEIGADPSIMKGLNLKNLCSDGLLNPGAAHKAMEINPDKIKSLAEDYLRRRAEAECDN